MEIKDISIIIALNNEESIVDPLYLRIKSVLESMHKTYELILVDDGSKDGTYTRMLAIYERDSNVNIIRLKKNVGQVLSFVVGVQYSMGQVIFTMDGDLQHSPEDIPKFLERIFAGYNVVNGWKRKRDDNVFTRVIPALIAKKVISFIFGSPIQDINSSFRAYRREALHELVKYGECLRFAPLLIKNKGSVCEISIVCKERNTGKTHFGLYSRLKRMIGDIRILWNIKTGNLSEDNSLPASFIRSKEFHACIN